MEKTKAAEGEQSSAASIGAASAVNRGELRDDQSGLIDGREGDRRKDRKRGEECVELRHVQVPQRNA